MKREPTRKDFAIIWVIQCIRSCDTYEQLLSCKRIIKLLQRQHDIKYTTSKYINLRFKQKLYDLRH